MEPYFLGYLLIPLGYTSALAALSASAERALERGHPEKAIKLLNWARRAPFLKSYRTMCEVNLITAAGALEDYELVDQIWSELSTRLELIRPYAASALASYGSTLIARGRYREAITILTDPVGDPKPEQRIDEIALLCCALARANLSSAYLSLGRFEEAQAELERVHDEAASHPVLKALITYLTGLSAYFHGQPEECRQRIQEIEVARLPVLYQAELHYHSAITLARCGSIEPAQRALSRVQWDTSSHPKYTRLRTLAQAEIAHGSHQDNLSLSYFKDLLALQHIDALAYLRASTLAKKLGQHELARAFLEGAVRLDPESHWSDVAQGRLLREYPGTPA